MKRIGIVTFVKCGNYGAELQAFALQHQLNLMGYNAEVIDLEKEFLTNKYAVKEAILERLKYYGWIKGTSKVINLVWSKFIEKRRKLNQQDYQLIRKRNERFEDFFKNNINHSNKHYTLAELQSSIDLPYDILITGSDQVWNYKQTNYLDVYFLKFAKNKNIRRLSYAASFGFSELPHHKESEYTILLNNLDSISVREEQGISIVKKCTNKKCSLVLDPTLLLTKKQWLTICSTPNKNFENKRFVVIYTITGSKYIYTLAEKIGKTLNAEVVNILGGKSIIKGYPNIQNIKDAGPKEFVSLMAKAVYMITDSFHGTVFSINFNVPFTTLLNPVSKNNSRVLSILKLLELSDRYMYDDEKNKLPLSLHVDFEKSNSILEQYRKISIDFLEDSMCS